MITSTRPVFRFAYSGLALALLAGGWPSVRAQAPVTTSPSPSAGAVIVTEATVVIPTYATGEPLKAPMFFDGRTYQGAKGPMYPYVLVDRLSDTAVDKTYRVVWLENEYVKVGILPDLGGRLWTGQDKTNGYNFFYHQSVIKPALIGMVGAWISGGVEWNIPHHHRASTFMPVQYRIEKKDDGSATVWVGELELRHRMRWAVGVTLHPGRSNVDASVRLINRTPLVQSFLYFSNVAVHANKDYQVIFPPSTQFGTQHAKSEFTTWPIGSGRYGGNDFSGVDVSWWKNHPTPISIFAWNDSDDFLAGYDHGKEAGLVHVADHHTVPGKKFFEWGPGSEGAYWDSILTDKDGPYLELMVGGYSDNQPDYSWIQPGETKVLEQTWYPLRNMGSVKQATREAAIDLELVRDGAARVAVNVSAEYKDATVIVRLGDKDVFSRSLSVSPAAPFSEVVTVPAGIKYGQLSAGVVASDGRLLVVYQPREVSARPFPAAVVPPPAPKDVKSNEELYLAGMRLEQFYSPAAEPEPYYEEALRRDPGDARAHTALGIRLLRRGLYEDAAKHLEEAVARVTKSYTAPRDAEALYYLGVARIGLGDDEGAEKVLGRATWDRSWRSAAYTRLAEIAARRVPQWPDWDAVLQRSQEAVTAEARNTRALTIEAIALGNLGRRDEGKKAVRQALQIDPLDAWAVRVWMGLESTGLASYVVMPKAWYGSESTLECAADYASLGLWVDTFNLLQEQPGAMAAYAAADVAQRAGIPESYVVERRAAAARAASPDYVFPFRLEHIGVLKRAMDRDPTDPRAPYYLGNLLMDIQPEAAIEAWKTSEKLDPSFAMVHRNLGWAAARRDATLDNAIAEYEKAIAADPKEPVFYYELDRVYEAANTDPQKRYAMLDAHRDTLALRDDSMSRLVKVGIRLGKYDEALSLLAGRHYHTWEGGTRFLVHDDYADAHLLRGAARLKAGKAADALADARAALEYPPNLGVGRPRHDDRFAEAKALEAQALAKMKRTREARDARSAITQDHEAMFGSHPPRDWQWSTARYYEAKAFEALGQREKAVALYEGLRAAGEAQQKATSAVDFFAKFGERESAGQRRANAQFLIGLGHLGLGHTATARDAFDEALRQDIGHSWANAMRAATQ